MSFAGGVGLINCDLLFSGLKRLPREGEEIYADDFRLRLGGGVPAIMIELSRLGVPVRLVTGLGTDLFSSFAKNELDASGVSYTNIYTGAGIPLTVTAVAITQGERTFLSSRAAKSETADTPESVYRYLKGASVVRMNGNPALHDVFKQLKAEGASLIYDTGWDEDMSLQKYARQLTLADYYLPNRAEALRITGAGDAREAALRLSKYFPRVLVKLDAEGCLLYENGRETRLGVLADTLAVDSTGAGDAFCAGFMFGLYHGYGFEDCARLATVMGGLCVREVGCLERRVEQPELLRLYQSVPVTRVPS